MGDGAAGTYRLPRAARMRRREEFTRTMRRGRSRSRPAFTLYALAVPGEGRRLGLVCGRRVGGAVVRNRVKRRLREIFRQAPALFRDGLWLVAVARPPVAALSYDRLRDETLGALAELVGENNGGLGPNCK